MGTESGESGDGLVDGSAVDLTSLRKHLRALATMGQSQSLILSCYTSFEHGQSRRDLIERRAQAIRATIPLSLRTDFDLAMARIFAQQDLHAPRTRGMAVFASCADSGFFQALEFRVPLPTLLVVEPAPVIYPLVELKDTFHRFIVVISTEGSARILEVDLGAVTREIWKTAPPMPAQLRQQWGRQHYLNQRHDRADQFLKEKLEILDRLMTSTGHSHLILAGTPRLTARIRDRLPDRLRAKLVDLLPAAAAAPKDVVRAAIECFIEYEQQESLDAADALCREVRRGDMAEIGTLPTIEALVRGQGDVVVMTDSFAPGRGSFCPACEAVTTTAAGLLPEPCAQCGAAVENVDLREHIVRLAERTGCGFERVSHHDQLSMLGGVGCTLRYPRSDR